MKAAIFNGDDFGLSSTVNAGIVRAHREGVLNSASLMVSEGARDEAAAYARAHSALDVGLHLVLSHGAATAPASKLGPLVDSNGAFSDHEVSAGFRYFFDRDLREPLTLECRAQIEAHLKLVGYLNHIDGHLNMHVHPTIFDIIATLAIEYRIPCIRIPREALSTTLALSRGNLGRKLREALIFRLLSRRARRIATERGIRCNDWLFGLHQSGNLSEAYVLGVVLQLREGTTEIYFHPALGAGSNLKAAAAEREVAILTGASIKDALRRNAVTPTTYAELARR